MTGTTKQMHPAYDASLMFLMQQEFNKIILQYPMLSIKNIFFHVNGNFEMIDAYKKWQMINLLPNMMHPYTRHKNGFYCVLSL